MGLSSSPAGTPASWPPTTSGGNHTIIAMPHSKTRSRAPLHTSALCGGGSDGGHAASRYRDAVSCREPSSGAAKISAWCYAGLMAAIRAIPWKPWKRGSTPDSHMCVSPARGLVCTPVIGRAVRHPPRSPPRARDSWPGGVR